MWVSENSEESIFKQMDFLNIFNINHRGWVGGPTKFLFNNNIFNNFIFILIIFILIRADQYVAMDEEEFKLSDEDIKWLLHHTEYDDKELNTMLAGEIMVALHKNTLFSYWH